MQAMWKIYDNGTIGTIMHINDITVSELYLQMFLSSDVLTFGLI